MTDAAKDAATEAMIAAIERDAGETGGLTGRPVLRAAVLAAMRTVPRRTFVPEEDAASAWENRPLSIGWGQTISQPFIVALMTDLLDLRPGDRVLEVGAGSGYQTAILAELGARVHAVEIVPALADAAACRLDALGYKGVALRTGDGSAGWPEHAPFDGILAAAAAPRIPPAWLEQLKPGGRLVMPLGRPWGSQELVLIWKDARGRETRKNILPVAFVPLTGGKTGA